MEFLRLTDQPRTSMVGDARQRNLNKRVKIHSKRLRRLWPRIATFLMPRDLVILGSTCRRLHRLLENDRVWQTQYDQVLHQHMTRLLLPHVTTKFDNDLSMKEKLRRVVHARHIHDPTNALQLRLREAEREIFRVKLQQHKVRSVVWINVPLVLALCCLSVWSYTIAVPDKDNLSATPAAQLRGTDASSSRPAVNPVKTFVLVTDLLLLVALMILSVGDLAGKALYTAGVLVAIEAVVMLAELLVAWSAPLEIAHAVLVLLFLVFNVVLVAREKKDYARKLAAFLPSY
ncbi:unnamed protein product [Peronospora farinosa]|uniref:F-box domain-containing protein n=1 Tax=Peronospora farinosa TaxID=134698 RepID=A0AAV0U0M8_9STRA|nr:unnamed protein product [Peronospora farinosa]CAI5729430.1 unnamed protein product [Peronospora farinosa]